MRIILTGATSFIGRAVLKELKGRGHTVTALRHSFDEAEAVSADAVGMQSGSDGGMHCLQRAAGNMPGELCTLPDTADAWIHFAWAGAGSKGRSDTKIQAYNVRMTGEAIKKAAELKCRRFVFAGSQAEYGHAQDGHKKKEDGGAEPVSEYGKAKLEVLKAASGFIGGAPMDYIHMRLFSVYGEGDHETSLISTLVRELPAGRDVRLSACGQLWNYMYIDDAAYVVAELAERGEPGVINVAGDDTRVLKDFIEEAAGIIGGKDRLIFGARDDNAEGAADLSPDITRLKAFGFVPGTSFYEGIKRLCKISRQGQ